VASLVEFPLEGGGSVVVEVEEQEPPDEAIVRRGFSDRHRSGEVVARAGQTLEAAFGRIQPAAGAMVTRLRDLPDAPEEIEIEFGVRLSAEVGAILAHTAGEANFRITLRWKRNRGAPV
jgi:hypothetical protein